MNRNEVNLINAIFYAHHGVLQEEHRIGGRYEVDVSMQVDFEKAAQDDDLSQTVDYEKIYNVIKELVTQNQFYLIERLAYLIATTILNEFPVVNAVNVTVRKPNPPVGGPCDRAEVVYRKSRS